MSFSSKAWARFQRNFLQSTIGVAEEDLDEHFRNLQRQPIDKSGSKPWCMSFDDEKNGNEIYIHYSDGSITINKDTIFPKEKMTVDMDHPLAGEFWENKDGFRMSFVNLTDKRKIEITAKGHMIYVNGKCIYPQPE